MSSTALTAYNILSPDVVVITLQKLQDFLNVERLYKELVLSQKKQEYKAKKKKRKTKKLSKGLPPAVNVVVAHDGHPLPPIAPPKKALPKPKPVVKRQKITCEFCKKIVCKDNKKRHQQTKKCLATTLTEADIAAPVSPSVVLNEDEPMYDDDDMIEAYS